MSSFIEALLGNAAGQGESAINDWRLRDQKLADEQRAQDMAIERQRAIDQLRMDMAEQQRQAKQKRTAEGISKAEAEGEKMSRAQALAALNKDYGSNLTEDDVLPEELDAYGPGVVGRLGNQVTAARNAGDYDAAEQLKASYDETVKALQAEYTQTMGERKQTEVERHNRETEDRMLKAVLNRGGANGSGAVKLRSSYTDGNGKRIGVMSDGSTIELGAGTSLDYSKALAGIIAQRSKEDSKFSKLPMAEQRKRAREMLGSAGVEAPEAPEAAAPAKAKPQSTKDVTPASPAGWKFLGVVK